MTKNRSSKFLNNKLTKNSSQQGFTLIEVMIAMVVMVIGVLGVLYLQLATIKGNSNAIGISYATNQVIAGIDMLESLDYSGESALDEGASKTIAELFGSDADAKKITDNFDGTLTYTVVDLNANDVKAIFNYADNFSAARGKQITVNVTKEAAGSSKKIQLQYVKLDI